MKSRPVSREPRAEIASRGMSGEPGVVPRHFEFDAGTGRHRLWGTVFLSREGLAVNLVGGEVPHIGAVAVSIPRPSRADARRRGATTSVITVAGHKEDELARPFAAELARRLDRTTVVVAGVHIRRARAADLARVFENAGRAVEVIVAKVKATVRESGGLAGTGGSEARGRLARAADADDRR